MHAAVAVAVAAKKELKISVNSCEDGIFSFHFALVYQAQHYTIHIFVLKRNGAQITSE